MLSPSNTKYKKIRKGRIKCNFEQKSNKLKFGNYGLQALERGYITDRQIEATRRTITGFMNRTGKIWIRIFPDLPITRKPKEVRMGKGKGAVKFWACKVKPGRVLYEVSGQNSFIIKEALKKASTKLPVSTKIIGPIV